jgi:predicted nuclease of predicted toxin-antitoxin system
MRILADVNVELQIVHWLRTLGHEVTWAGESSGTASDSELLQTARERNAVFLTHDLDLGDLAFVKGEGCRGIVLLRLGGLPRDGRLQVFRESWAEIESHVEGCLVVVKPGLLRIRRLG